MAPQNSPDSPLVAHVKRLWIHGFLAGFGVVLIILLVWFFIWGWPWGATPEGPGEPATPATPPVPSAQATPGPRADRPPIALKNQLEAVLDKLAEANQNKDLPQLLSLYEPTFPDLQHKTEEISRTWAMYDYRSLRFRIDEIKSPSPDIASARVTWEVETRNRSTHEIKNLTKTYLVQFHHDSGRWRIKSLEKPGKSAEEEKS
jgi:ketosteroid isomerase-like protein